MAISESLFFSFNGQYSSDFGILNVNFESGMIKETFAPSRKINETTVKGNPKPHFQGVEYEPIELDLSFAFQDRWNEKKIREVARWLIQDYYKPLWFSENPDRIYYCMVEGDSDLIHNGLQQGYITLKMRCDSAYTYSPVYTSDTYDLSTNTSEGTPIKFFNDGDTICKPEIFIEKVGNGGEFKIVNRTNAGKEFKFSSPNVSGVLTFAGDIIDKDVITIGSTKYEFDTDGSVTAGNTPVKLYVPDPTVVPTLTVNTDTSSTLAVGTYYVKYTWNSANGQTLSSGVSSVTIAAQQKLTVQTPSLPFGAVSASIYVGLTAGSQTLQGVTYTGSFILNKPLVAGTALPTSNTTKNNAYYFAIRALTNAINQGGTYTAIQNTSSITLMSSSSASVAVASSTNNASWGTSLLVSDGLIDGENIYVDNEREYIETSVSNKYRYDLFNNQYLEMLVGTNNLIVYGNAKITFRYEFKTLQG